VGSNANLKKSINDILANKAAGLSQNKLAALIGISSAALSQWLKDKYPGNVKEIEAQIALWLESYTSGQGYSDDLLPEPEWIGTPSAKRVWDTIEMAHRLKSLTIAYGAAGAGKTVTARHYAETHPNVWIATPTKATASVRGILDLLCEVMSIRPSEPGSYEKQKAVVRKLIASGGVLIIDDAQVLAAGTLDFLRQIHDLSKTGMVWVGNEPLYTQLTGGVRSQKFAQIFSRIAQRTHLESSKPEDAKALVSAMGIKDSQSVEYLVSIGTLPGGLRGIIKTVQLAQIASKGANKNLDRSTLARAFQKLAKG